MSFLHSKQDSSHGRYRGIHYGAFVADRTVAHHSGVAANLVTGINLTSLRQDMYGGWPDRDIGPLLAASTRADRARLRDHLRTDILWYSFSADSHISASLGLVLLIDRAADQNDG
ncbi:MAG: hypothetical protein CMH13_17915 [Martelella sp.]|nr:hypothetical protein [Martelella sp.]